MAKPIRLRVNVAAPWPARVVGGDSIAVTKQNGIYTVKSNYPALAPLAPPIANPSQKLLKLYDPIAGAYSTVPLTGLPYVAGGGGRETLTAPRIYYVAPPPTGSDSNSGLSPSAPFATIQKAIDVTAALDMGVYPVTINVAAGTYTATANHVVVLKSYLGQGPVTITGDVATPQNVVLNNTASGTSCIFADAVRGLYLIQGFKLTSPNGNGIALLNASFAKAGLVDFGQCGSLNYHMQVTTGSTLVINGSTFISGGAYAHYGVEGNGNIYDNNQTVTFLGSGTITFSGYFAYCGLSALLYSGGLTFTLGSVTVAGTRYSVMGNSVINTGSGNPNYFPGNAAGTSFAGGQYI